MRYFTLLIFGCVLSMNALAQSTLPSTNSQPRELFENGYLDLPVHLQVKADVEHKIIRYFFDFSCHYCRSVKDVMQVWSNTLPSDYRFVYHHVGTYESQEYYLMAATMTYIANLDIPASQKHQFMDNMFEHVNKVGTPEMMMRLIKEATTDINIDIELLGRYLVSDASLKDYQAHIELQRQISLSQTPSILIGGRFLTHLGLTDGKPALWIELLNKVTSVHYYLENSDSTSLSSN